MFLYVIREGGSFSLRGPVVVYGFTTSWTVEMAVFPSSADCGWVSFLPMGGSVGVVGVRGRVVDSIVTTIGRLCNRSMPRGVMTLRGAGDGFRNGLALIMFPFLGVSGGAPREATLRVNSCLGRGYTGIVTSFGIIGNFLGLSVTPTT